MQIQKLIVAGHKCLVDVLVELNTIEGGSSTVFIGENGTGKSTMLETILRIMMSFDSKAIEESIDFSYELRFLHAGNTVEIRHHDHIYHISVDCNLICQGRINTVNKHLRDRGLSLFPERVIFFYSGENDKVRPLINSISVTHKKKCRKAIAEYLDSLEHGNTYDSGFPKRKYQYCYEEYIPIYLLSILCGSDSFEKHYLMTQCHMNSIAEIDIVLDLATFPRSVRSDIYASDYSSFFRILDFIDHDLAQLLSNCSHWVGKNKILLERCNLTEINVDSIAVFNFFEKLKMLYNAGFYFNVKIGEDEVKPSELSEGQRQLIKMLGMLGVCKNEDCLVLMDEPDAHMNPTWKYEIKETIDRSLRDAFDTQALIATHDPLVINGVSKEFIRVFVHNKAISDDFNRYYTKVIVPNEDTEGLGIDGLLQSEYYGLRTSYDKKTTDKFIRRQELYAKLINSEASEDEKTELRELTKEIGSLPVSYNSIDFLYDDFIRVFKNTDLFSKEYLSYDEIQRRREKIKEIIEALYEGEV